MFHSLCPLKTLQYNGRHDALHKGDYTMNIPANSLPKETKVPEQQDEMEQFKKNYARHYNENNSEITEKKYLSAKFYFSAELSFLPEQLKHYPALDFGAGHGLLLRYLKESGFSHTMGIDIDPTLAAEAATYLHPYKIPVINRDAFEFLPTQQNHFGLITAFDVIEHFPLKEGFKIVKAIYDALVPGGIAVFRTPNMANIFGAYSLYIDITHQMGFTEHNLTDLLYHGGFQEAHLHVPNWAEGHPNTLKFAESKKFHEYLFSLQDRTPARCFDKNIVVYGVKHKKD